MAEDDHKDGHHDHAHCGHDHSHDHGAESVAAAAPAPKKSFSLKETYNKVSGFLHAKPATIGLLVAPVLLASTALATPAIATTLGAAAIMAGSLACLARASDTALDNAIEFGTRKKLSPMTLGLALGGLTTIPELAASLMAIHQGSPAIAIGNVLGGNVAHTLLILGATAAIAGIGKGKELGLGWKFNTLAMAGTTAVFGAELATGHLSPAFGAAMLGGAAAYLAGRTLAAKKAGATTEEIVHGHSHGEGGECCEHHHEHDHEHDHHHEHEHKPASKPWANVLWAAGGVASLIGSSSLLVDSASHLALNVGVSEAIVGALGVGLGTALPELWINVKAARRKQNDLAVGNVLGCNILTSLVVGGAVSLYGGAVPAALGLHSPLGLLNLGAYAGSAALATGALFASKGTMKKWQGYAALGLYGAYMAGAVALHGAAPVPPPSLHTAPAAAAVVAVASHRLPGPVLT